MYILLFMNPVTYPAEVGFLLAGEDLEGGGLADAVGPHQAQHHARPRHWQPVQLKAVGRISAAEIGYFRGCLCSPIILR